jgi:uncharacterized membrane protein
MPLVRRYLTGYTIGMNNFSATGIIKWAWETFKKRPWIFVGMIGVIFLVNIVAGMVLPEGVMVDEGGLEISSVRVLSSILSFLVQTLVAMGAIAFMLKAHDALESVELTDLWHPQRFLTYLAATILLSLAVMVGFVLLIIPGVIAAVRLQFAPYLVIDRGLGPIEALKESTRITKGHSWQLLALMGLILLINLLGVLALLVGLLVTIPLSYLAIAHAYRTLEHSASEVVPATPVSA